MPPRRRREKRRDPVTASARAIRRTPSEGRRCSMIPPAVAAQRSGSGKLYSPRIRLYLSTCQRLRGRITASRDPIRRKTLYGFGVLPPAAGAILERRSASASSELAPRSSTADMMMPSISQNDADISIQRAIAFREEYRRWLDLSPLRSSALSVEDGLKDRLLAKNTTYDHACFYCRVFKISSQFVPANSRTNRLTDPRAQRNRVPPDR